VRGKRGKKRRKREGRRGGVAEKKGGKESRETEGRERSGGEDCGEGGRRCRGEDMRPRKGQCLDISKKTENYGNNVPSLYVLLDKNGTKSKYKYSRGDKPSTNLRLRKSMLSWQKGKLLSKLMLKGKNSRKKLRSSPPRRRKRDINKNKEK